MKFFMSKFCSAAVLNVVEIFRLLVIGAVCITAIVECGLLALVFLAVVGSAYYALKEDL